VAYSTWARRLDPVGGVEVPADCLKQGPDVPSLGQELAKSVAKCRCDGVETRDIVTLPLDDTLGFQVPLEDVYACFWIDSFGAGSRVRMKFTRTTGQNRPRVRKVYATGNVYGREEGMQDGKNK
jgi:hypothetical protein